MQTNGFLLPIRIGYRPPKWLVPLLFASHLLAIFCLYFTGVDLRLRILVLVAVMISLTVRVFFPVAARYQGCLLALNADDRWFRVVAEQGPEELYLVQTVMLASEMIFLQFTDGRRDRHLFILTGENVDADTLRRLRVRLLLPGTRTAASPSS